MPRLACLRLRFTKPVAVVASLVAGILVNRYWLPECLHEHVTPEVAQQDPEAVAVGISRIPSSDQQYEVSLEIAARLPDDHRLEGNDFQEEPGEPPRPMYSYRFPFEDGRRAEAPTGSVVESVRRVYEEISGAILAKWGGQYEHTLFKAGMNFSDNGKVVEDKMLNAVVEQGGFVAAFTGISTTAGYDCLYEESYPVMLNATMSRLFAAAGVRFEAINVAMGNTRPAPYSYCVDAHAGIDADIISWEMDREVADRACGPAAEAIELFVRSATVLPRQPAVLLLSASPDQNYCTAEQYELIRKHNRGLVGECEYEPPAKSLMSAYEPFGLHHLFMNELVPSYTCRDRRFSRDELFRKGKISQRPMSWWPGPKGHELVAEVLFMNYANIFLNALERLELKAPAATAQQLRRESEYFKLNRKAAAGSEISEEISGDGGVSMGAGRGDILPAPKWCGGWRFCEGAGNYRCANTYLPLGGRRESRLVDLVAERTPVVNSNRTEHAAEPTTAHWALTLDEAKPSVLAYIRRDSMHKPIDMKWILVGEARSGAIEFEFETKGVRTKGQYDSGNAGESARAIKDSRVVVCSADINERVALTNTTGVRFSIDGEPTMVLRPVDNRYLNENSCVLLDMQLGVGRHTLSVEPLMVGWPLVSVSHMIYPA